MMICTARAFPRTARILSRSIRAVSTLQGYPHIFVFPDPSSLGNSHLLSLLSTDPPNPKLAIGSTTKLPPTVDSFTANRNFSSILQEVLAQHAVEDEEVRAQAQAMASSSGSGLGSGGVFFPGQSKRRRGVHGGAGGLGGDGAGGASSQGGAGGGGVGGFIHVYDSRNTPSYGRIPFPEDIFGSMEVDSRGNFVGENGNYQSNSGSYRLITKEGILGLSPFLRQKVVERLKELEKAD